MGLLGRGGSGRQPSQEPGRDVAPDPSRAMHPPAEPSVHASPVPDAQRPAPQGRVGNTGPSGAAPVGGPGNGFAAPQDAPFAPPPGPPVAPGGSPAGQERARSVTSVTEPGPGPEGNQWREPTGPLAARAVDVFKVYGSGDNEVRALNGVTVGFERGRFTAIMGPSGSGKSTLMHCLAGLDRVSGGAVLIGDSDLSQLGDKALTALRRDKLGFVFQSFNLVPTLTAKENITLPLDIAGRKVDPQWMGTVVDTLKLRDRLDHRPSELSGGQQQRVACARAIVGRPEVIFGDEPTGNLDSRTSGEVLAILRDSVDNLGQTVVIVTHDPRAAAWADRVVFLADGRLAGQMFDPTAESVLDAMKNMEG